MQILNHPKCAAVTSDIQQQIVTCFLILQIVTHQQNRRTFLIPPFWAKIKVYDGKTHSLFLNKKERNLYIQSRQITFDFYDRIFCSNAEVGETITAVTIVFNIPIFSRQCFIVCG